MSRNDSSALKKREFDEPQKPQTQDFRKVYDAVYPNTFQESRWSRFWRHFNPGVIGGVGLSIYAMRSMLLASRRNDAVAFQNAQRLRMMASLGAVVSLVGGYVYKNQDRVREDWNELMGRLRRD
ncbi:hypothetical protein HDU91_003967 [Kappamyces sp. JEL0680]|nr:hypothetical protein HDU91_003967 [Kappamyces sp. JEL0680]